MTSPVYRTITAWSSELFFVNKHITKLSSQQELIISILPETPGSLRPKTKNGIFVGYKKLPPTALAEALAATSPENETEPEEEDLEEDDETESPSKKRTPAAPLPYYRSSCGEFRNDVLDGNLIEFFADGTEKRHSYYHEGKLEGLRVTFNKSGTIRQFEVYKNGKLLKKATEEVTKIVNKHAFEETDAHSLRLAQLQLAAEITRQHAPSPLDAGPTQRGFVWY